MNREERQHKIAKLDLPVEGLDKLHLPRSNSSASLRTPSKAAYAAAAQLRRQSSAKKQQRPSAHGRRNTLASLNSSFENLTSMDLNADERQTQNDAGSALREVMANRTPHKGMLTGMHLVPPANTYPRTADPARSHRSQQSQTASTTSCITQDSSEITELCSSCTYATSLHRSLP